MSYQENWKKLEFRINSILTFLDAHESKEIGDNFRNRNILLDLNFGCSDKSVPNFNLTSKVN